MSLSLRTNAMSCSIQQDGAQTEADPGPAGPDSDAEERCERDERGETPAEQRHAETAAAGGAECGVHR